MFKTKEVDFICIEDDLENAVAKAKKIYLEGGVFVYPTDTIYGFGGNPFNEEALLKINEIKGRHEGKNYIMLVDSLDTLSSYVELNSEKHLDFLIAIWPNPISCVLKLNKKTSSIWNSDTAAFRIPNHRFCIKLASELHMPIISTSVNKSGASAIDHPEIIKQEFGTEVSAIFYSNKKILNKASTVIDLTGDEVKLLREGKIKFEDIIAKFH